MQPAMTAVDLTLARPAYTCMYRRFVTVAFNTPTLCSDGRRGASSFSTGASIRARTNVRSARLTTRRAVALRRKAGVCYAQLGIFFSTSTGHTEDIAGLIKEVSLLRVLFCTPGSRPASSATHLWPYMATASVAFCHSCHLQTHTQQLAITTNRWPTQIP